MTMAANAQAENILRWEIAPVATIAGDESLCKIIGTSTDDTNAVESGTITLPVLNDNLENQDIIPFVHIPTPSVKELCQSKKANFLLPSDEMTTANECDSYNDNSLSIDDLFGIAPSDQVMTLNFAPYYE